MARTPYTLEAYQAAAKALADKGGDVPFVCVRCGTVQSMRSFVHLGTSADAAERAAGFSCVGRYAAGVGCDWTCGGLLGDLGRGAEVTTPDGAKHARFPFGTREEADRLRAAGGAPFVRDGFKEGA